MRRAWICFTLAWALVACDSGDAPVPGTPAAHSPDAAAETRTEPAPAPPGQQGVAVLEATGIELEFPHAINYDIHDVSRNGTPRHRVLVEVLGGDFNTVVAQFNQALVDNGYTMTSDSSTGAKIERVYARNDMPTYYLLIQPVGAGPKLGNPDATGSIHIMWNRRR